MTVSAKKAPSMRLVTIQDRARKRKPHKKSRNGCRNCKIRRVKCSEVRPACFQCRDFGILCNYDTTIPDLQPLSMTAECVDFDSPIDAWVSPFSNNGPILDVVNSSLRQDSINQKWKDMMMYFDNADLARLARFREKTVLSIGVKQVSRMWQGEVFQLACTHRFLMHLVQALTQCHDRCKSINPPPFYP
jgi:hypothetical protein